jgi:hypothetical protein
MNQDNGGIIGKINTPTTSVASGVWSIEQQFEAQSSSTWPLAFPQTTIANSCRFDDASSDNLSRTFSGSSTSNRILTISCWYKKVENGISQYIFDGGNSSGNENALSFNTDDEFLFGQYNGSSDDFAMATDAKCRDLGAWYHLVAAIDTTQSTQADRLKMYINGNEQSIHAGTQVPQNLDLFTLGASTKYLGRPVWTSSSRRLNGYLAEFYLIDGQQLTPTSFGAFNPVTNIWEPIQYTGTFGNYGFKLDFTDSSALGADVSGNSNNFTVNNLTSVDQSTDTCSNNFATLNPLNNTTDGNPAVYSEGALKFVTAGDASGKRYGGTGTIGVSKGKWYWEVKHGSTDGGGTLSIGITHDMGLLSRSSPQYVGGDNASFGYYGGDGDIYHNNSDNTYGNTFGDGDIIGVALDVDNSKLYFSKNGTWQNSGDPTSGSTGTGAFSIDSLSGTVDGVYVPAVSDINSTPNVVGEMNFGAPPFSISSGNADANGHGNFEYAVPSGYFALCTKNLAEFG